MKILLLLWHTNAHETMQEMDFSVICGTAFESDFCEQEINDYI
jgi:hypothetical protein